ncbi:MAG: Rdx family protein [Deltaproteobacteria bacterium]|nr:Rdx family protein [Deltaproteobacteria bacterium]
MAAAIRAHDPSISIDFIRGEKGIFDVKLEERLIWSKYREGRFPEHTEIIDLLR